MKTFQALTPKIVSAELWSSIWNEPKSRLVGELFNPCVFAIPKSNVQMQRWVSFIYLIKNPKIYVVCFTILTLF